MLPRGRRIAIDYGDVRCGVAMSDPSGIIASPLVTLETEKLCDSITDIINAEEVKLIYFGLPLHLSGQEGVATKKAREMAEKLGSMLADTVTVRLIDERLSTKSAIRQATESGRTLSKNDVDQMAAVVILESALERERLSGNWAGYEL